MYMKLPYNIGNDSKLFCNVRWHQHNVQLCACVCVDDYSHCV